ncbi:hypothetical protein G3O08_15715 [Cryomorpha ignava]|uniref:Uncharacterized protein n=1 Tax=Cryomorpha ignava TaxID=101383 RepID=A0A7K3WTS1_9FLAO|nr:hypothetical protein [Cryomorpha ignava]NEN24948.1 hypothetical protein [Cryomorpha ignava]
MEIKFQTKEQSKADQEKAFLALTPTERVYSFFAMIERMKDFPTKAKNEKKNNFMIEIKVSDL